MAIQQLTDGRWQVYYRRDGKIKREYFGRGPAAEANARARHKELNLQKRRPPRQPDTGPDFLNCAEVYLSSKTFNENSRKLLKIRLQSTILPILGHKRAFRMADQDLDDYVSRRRRDGVKDSTIHRELTDIKAILNFAAKRRPAMIPYNPVRDYRKPQEDDDVIIPPSPAETAAILAAAADHLKRAMMISYYTGLRPGAVELLRLTWSDVYWESETILIRSADKGGIKHRQIPIHPQLIQSLKEWWATDKKGSGPIVHIDGDPIKSIKTAWKGALRRADITRRLRPYDMRHKFVTESLERGDDIKTLAEIVGSSPRTLMANYQHVSNAMRRKTIAGIPPLELQKYTQKPKETRIKKTTKSKS